VANQALVRPLASQFECLAKKKAIAVTGFMANTERAAGGMRLRWAPDRLLRPIFAAAAHRAART